MPLHDPQTPILHVELVMAVIERKFAVEAAYQIPGWCWPVELGVLYDVAERSNFHIEIGTFCGKSFFPFVCGMRPNSRAICIDPIVLIGPNYVAPSEAWVASVLSATIDELRRLRPDVEISHCREHSLAAANKLRELLNQVDTIYIDGDHNFAEVTRDIDCWLPFLKTGGRMMGHDFWCNQPGVMDAVHDRFQDKFTVFRDTRIWSYEYS